MSSTAGSGGHQEPVIPGVKSVYLWVRISNLDTIFYPKSLYFCALK